MSISLPSELYLRIRRERSEREVKGNSLISLNDIVVEALDLFFGMVRDSSIPTKRQIDYYCNKVQEYNEKREVAAVSPQPTTSRVTPSEPEIPQLTDDQIKARRRAYAAALQDNVNSGILTAEAAAELYITFEKETPLHE